MAQSKEYKDGYEAAIEQLRKMIAGNSQQNAGGSGGNGPQGTDQEGNPAQKPELNKEDQKKADKNSKIKQSNNSQASSSARNEAAEACGSCGGMISQEAGSAIAKSEGYDDEDCKVSSDSSLSREWTEATIAASSQMAGKGKGNIFRRVQDLYLTSHDWKGDLKKYIGRALSSTAVDSKWGAKKWLAQDELKKTDKPKENDLDRVIFLIDVSGSVSDDLLRRILSECWTIIKKKGIKKVTFAYFDDGICKIETNDTMHDTGDISPDMISKIKSNYKPKGTVGGGGTDYNSALKQIIDMLKKSHKSTELLMVFSDGYFYKPADSKPRIIKHIIYIIYDNTSFEMNDGSKVIHLNSADIGK